MMVERKVNRLVTLLVVFVFWCLVLWAYGEASRYFLSHDALSEMSNVIDETESEKRFSYHAPKGDRLNRYKRLRAEGKEMAEFIVRLCPDSRERELAIMKLEEAVMWANAAIARNE